MLDVFKIAGIDFTKDFAAIKSALEERMSQCDKVNTSIKSFDAPLAKVGQQSLSPEMRASYNQLMADRNWALPIANRLLAREKQEISEALKIIATPEQFAKYLEEFARYLDDLANSAKPEEEQKSFSASSVSPARVSSVKGTHFSTPKENVTSTEMTNSDQSNANGPSM